MKERKMERNKKAVCSVVGFLALLTLLTGFAAEATRNKEQYPSLYTCKYPKTPAYGLGITAATSQLLAQIVISAASRCICCCTKGPHQSNPNWTLAVVCFAVSWFGTLVAFPMFVTGAVVNNAYNSELDIFPGFCYTVKPGAFAGAAILSLASLALGTVYYLILHSEEKPVPTRQAEIAMGQPQVNHPQNGEEPVFVHEDTYVRRQFV